jgi:hypothetical protein
MADERLHLRLAEVAAALAGEPAAEALHPRHAQPLAPGVQDHALALQDVQAVLAQHRRDLVLLVAVVVVVAEHGDDRHGQLGELVGDDVRLLDGAVPGQVTGEQEHVGVAPEVFQRGAQAPAGVLAQMDVPDGGDPDHCSVSRSIGSSTSTTRTSLCTCRSGASSVTTSVRRSRRSAVITSPRRYT